MAKDRGRFACTYVALVDDPDFKALSPAGKLVFWTLKHSPENNQVGIFTAFHEGLQRRTGLPRKAIDVAMIELKIARFILVDGDCVWIRNHLKFDPFHHKSNSNHGKGLIPTLEGLPKTGLIHQFLEKYRSEGYEIPWYPPWDPPGIPNPVAVSVAVSVTDTITSTKPHPIPEGRPAPIRRRRDVSEESVDSPDSRALIGLYNQAFGTNIGDTPGNLKAGTRALREGYTPEQIQAVFSAVVAKSTPSAEWCANHNREFEFLIRPEYYNREAHKSVPSMVDRVLNELATGRRLTAAK